LYPHPLLLVEEALLGPEEEEVEAVRAGLVREPKLSWW
jgi:hypothetical protein